MIIAVLPILLAPSSLAQGAWQMHACIDPDNYPYSSREGSGIDDRVARMLADELGAELVPVWTPLGARAVRLLQSGECDVILGAAEGASGVLNTVPYYRAPFVFVYRSDAPFEIGSMEDQVLSRLRIAIAPNGLAQYALAELGLTDNSLPLSPDRSVRGYARAEPLIQAVMTGMADVAILYGPDAAPLVEMHSDSLAMKPVTPEIVPPLIQMFRIVTLGVREGDESFRDRLNVAIARRWEDIQSVFSELGIPLLSSPRPFASERGSEEVLLIGAVLPSSSGLPAITDSAGNAARTGALLAEDLLAAQGNTPVPDVLLASSPTPEAAARAARRLVATEGVDVLLGGIGAGQAAALRDVATETDTIFFNLGATADELRQDCRRNTFHIEASASMYLDAIIAGFQEAERSRWFLVHTESERGEALLESSLGVLEQSPAEVEVVGTASVQPGFANYRDTLASIARADTDMVLLLLEPQEQEFFLSQFTLGEEGVWVTGFPWAVMQTREYLARLLQVTPESGSWRAALWETSLASEGAAELIERFMSRSGQTMEPSGWAAYAAVKIATEATQAVGSSEAAALVEYLESPEAVFDLAKGPGTGFRAADHQLLQAMYIIALNRDASWNRQVSQRVELAELVSAIPEPGSADYLDRLASLGAAADQEPCSERN